MQLLTQSGDETVQIAVKSGLKVHPKTSSQKYDSNRLFFSGCELGHVNLTWPSSHPDNIVK